MVINSHANFPEKLSKALTARPQKTVKVKLDPQANFPTRKNGREAFLGQISAPCQEIDVSFHKLIQNGNFVSEFLSSVTTTLKHRFQSHVTLKF